MEGPPAEEVKAHFGTGCDSLLEGDCQCCCPGSVSAQRAAHGSFHSSGQRARNNHTCGSRKGSHPHCSSRVHSLRVKVERSDPGQLFFDYFMSGRETRSSFPPDPAGCPGLPARLRGLWTRRYAAVSRSLSCAQSSGRCTHHLSALIRSGSQVQRAAGRIDPALVRESGQKKRSNAMRLLSALFCCPSSELGEHRRVAAQGTWNQE